MYKDNSKFQLQGVYSGISIYTCAKESDYHISRYIEAVNWQSYASCGISKDHLKAIADELLARCNDEKNGKNLRTDIAAIANVLQYKMRFPVDEKCSVHLGAILSFAEWELNGEAKSEPENVLDDYYVRKKLELADKDPDAYTFFLSWGIANTPEYKEHSHLLTDMGYLRSRAEQIRALLPTHLEHLAT